MLKEIHKRLGDPIVITNCETVDENSAEDLIKSKVRFKLAEQLNLKAQKLKSIMLPIVNIK